MITIDYKDRRPLYQQIIEKVDQLILNGVLKIDEKLPSVRTLAMELSINPNTIQRAYQDLEKMGLIYTVQGKGCFVSPDASNTKQTRRDEVWKDLKQVVDKAKLFDIAEGDFIEKSSRFFRPSEEVPKND